VTAGSMAGPASPPLAPPDADTWWLVETGEIEVFQPVRWEDGTQSAPVRAYSVPAGSVLLPVGDTATLSPLPGTTVTALPRHVAASDATLRPAMERWAAALYGAAVAASGVGRPSRVLPASGPMSLADGESAATTADVTWIRVHAGECRVSTVGDAAGIGAGRAVFPLVAPAVVVAAGDSEIEVLDQGALDPAAAVEGLEALRTVLALAAAFSIRAARTRADARVEQLDRAESEAVTDALRRVTRVLAKRSAGEPAPARELGTWQLALDSVGTVLGVRFPDIRTLGPAATDVNEIAALAGTRARDVALQPGWRKTTVAPFLAFRTGGAEPEPVAVLPRNARRWFWVDPATGERRRVDAEVDKSLDRVGVAFVRPFPPGPVRLGTLVGFLYRAVKRPLGGVAVAGLLAAVMSLVAPVSAQLVYGQVFPSGRRSVLLAVAGLLTGAGIAIVVLDFTRKMASVRVGGLMESVLMPAMWDRLLRLPVSTLRRYQVGDLQARLTGVSTARTLLEVGITAGLGMLFSMVSFVVMFLYSWQLTLVVLAGITVFVAGLIPLTVARARRMYPIQTLTGQVTATQLQLLQAIPRIRVAGAEGRALDTWAKVAGQHLAATWRLLRLNLWEVVLVTAVPALTGVAIYATAGTALLDTLDPGNFMGFMTAIGLFTGAFGGLYRQLNPILRIAPLYRRIKPLLEEPAEDAPGAVDPGRLEGAVELDTVSFRYDAGGPLILDGVTIRAAPGEFVAITGRSGAGKSTIVRLLLGFETPESGRVLYDGKDLAGRRKRGVRREIGAVLQNASVPGGPILNAILGDSGLPDSAAWKAAEAAGIAHDIKALPMGMQTMISPGNPVFSGGQIQRISIAHAIVRDPKIVVLDEATSTLDNTTQAAVAHALDSLQATRIVVAHRLSTIREADRIYVLDRGHVVQTGTYDTLMAQPGLFQELASRQLLSTLPNANPPGP